MVSPDTSEILHTPHGFFSRIGGVSTGLYDGLNCGPGSGDDPAQVAENRRIVAGHIGGRRDTPVLSCYQIHSTVCVHVGGDFGEDRPKADAMVTNRPGLILGILTADCTPVLFHDPVVGVIGAAHAGWKGALGGILENTLVSMEALGANRQHICAAIGPTIHQQSYEVSVPFRDTFLTANSANDSFFTRGKDAEHFQFDLPAFVIARLQNAGIARTDMIPVDTYHSDRHFSYRRTTHRSEVDYGRQISAIMLKP